MMFLVEATVYISITAAALLLFKGLFRHRLPAKWHVWLWALVLIRFAVPSLPQSELSVFNAVPMPAQRAAITAPLAAGQPEMPLEPITALPETMAEPAAGSGLGLSDILLFVWGVGAGALLLYFVCIYSRWLYQAGRCHDMTAEAEELLTACRRRLGLRRSVRLLCGGDSPMLMGVLRPKILLPTGYTAAEQRDILLHELCHLKNGDLIIIWTAVLVLCLQWFNPLVWYSFFVLRRDVELYCDERVLRCSESKKEYASLLLKTALRKNRFIAGTTSLQNGEGEVARRIRYMACFKKPGVIGSIFLVAIALVLALVCLTNGMQSCQMSEARYREFQERMVGSSMADMDYADGKRAIFHYFDAILVYDIESARMEHCIDLNLLNCATAQQGSSGLRVQVSDDGRQALLTNYGPAEEIAHFDNYLVDLDSGRAKKTGKTALDNPFIHLLETYGTVPDAKGWFSDRCAVYKGEIYYVTCQSAGFSSMKLCTRLSDGTTREQYVFENVPISVERETKIAESLPDGAAVEVNSGVGFSFYADSRFTGETRKLVESAAGGEREYNLFLQTTGFDLHKFSDQMLDVLLYRVRLAEGSSVPYLYIFDGVSGELFYRRDLQTAENEKRAIQVFDALNRFFEANASDYSDLYFEVWNYLESEFRRVYTPHYEILGLQITDWEENEEGNEALLTFTMTSKNYDKDPDTVGYIRRETMEQGSASYQQLKDEYLRPRDWDYQLKVTKDEAGELTLYYNSAPVGQDWQPLTMDDFIAGEE